MPDVVNDPEVVVVPVVSGPVGPTGPANTLTVGSVITGSPGSPATVSITGTAPNQTLNFSLPRGAVGESVSLTLGTVTTLPAGEAASATITGDAPNQVLNLFLPEGAAGDTGATGAAGPANSLTMGAVTTSGAGTSASAQITGTAPNQTLELTIPRGDKGVATTLTIGTVTTSESGGPAEATLTGAAPNQTLSLVLPRGARGIQGETGVVIANAPATYNDSTRTIGVAVGTTSGTVAAGNDARLSDQRVPTDGSVTTAKIADNAVTSDKIAPGTVIESDVGDGSITTVKLADDAVTAVKIAANAVGSSELADASVDTAAIQDASVTNAKLAGSIDPSKVSGTAVITTDARLSDTRTPTDGSVSTAKIAGKAVTQDKIGDKAVSAAQIADDTITASQIAADAVGSSELSNSAVDTAALQAKAVTLSKLDDNSSLVVSATEPASKNVGTLWVDSSSTVSPIVVPLSSDQISNGAVTNAKLAGSIDPSKVSGTAITAADTGTVTNTMLAGSITAAKLDNGHATFSNADATVAATTRRLDQIGTLSAARTVTLPAANAVAAGTEIIVSDVSGSVTASNTLTVQRAGSDTINGGTSEIMRTAYSFRRMVSDGTSKWTFDGGILRAGRNLADIGDAATARTNLGAVGTARTLTAGTGLSGGGDLSADRTLSIATGGVTNAMVSSTAAISTSKLANLAMPQTLHVGASSTYNWIQPAGTNSMQEGLEVACIVIPNVSGTFDRIGISIVTTAGSTGAVIRLGIREANGTTLQPGTLILDAGTVDATSTGFKEITISQAFTAGVPLALTATCQGAAATRPTIFSTPQLGPAWAPTTSTSLGNPYVWTRSSISGALTGGADFSATQNSAATPKIFVRVT